MKNLILFVQVGVFVYFYAILNHVDGRQYHGFRHGISYSGRGVERVGTKSFCFPFVTVIETWDGNNWNPVGHGTIYNPWTVLTTVTILNKISQLIDKRDVRVAAGSYNLKEFENTRQYRQPCMGEKHPNSKGPKNNLAVLHLSEAFRLNKYVNNIHFPLATDSVSGECRFGGFAGTGNAFGEISEKRVTLASSCTPSDDSIICTDSGPCPGDEGAPLVCTLSNRMFAYGIANDVNGTSCPTGNSNYFSTRNMDRSWFNKTLENGREKCRDYFKF